MKVYVVYEDQGYDGNSVPLKVFSSKEKAIEYCEEEHTDTCNFPGCRFDWEEIELE